MKHICYDLTGCAVEHDQQDVRDFLLMAAHAIDMTVLDGPRTVEVEEGGPLKAGITGFVIIAESHVSVHIWPGLGKAYIDALSCKAFDEAVLRDLILDFFSPREVISQSIARTPLGLEEP